eukprot:CAMPEP_0113626194 /NCGR_PEP_ID=MMETSP0017_2-20120614/13544_1 /TAXON_ID=2856 /ORGANISM="Cylindrotheca closterium" /LENGTH=47 /DNA_ID=CAMNT_0000536361 /DNA_START=77 /DNA_END=217 /DNA_ORIENTATION=+ /assembly_acc=CAM_ASM_000147
MFSTNVFHSSHFFYNFHDEVPASFAMMEVDEDEDDHPMEIDPSPTAV